VDCLENQFTSYDLCEENHERRVEARVQALLAPVDDTPLKNVRPGHKEKLQKSFKLRKACGLIGITKECLMHFPRRPLVHLTHLFNHCLRLSHFPKSWKKEKVIALPKPRRDPELSQNSRPTAALSTKGKLFPSNSENSPKAH
jgi:hypothetical protein